MVYSVYAVENSGGKIYIGHTKDIERRLKRHNKELPGKSSSFTRINKGPWTLIHEERFETREEAVIRERELKSSRGRDFLKRLRKNTPK